MSSHSQKYLYFDSVPDTVWRCLAERGIKADQILYTSKSDLDGEGKYVDTYLFLDSECVHILNGYEQFIPGRKTLLRTEPGTDRFDVTDYSYYKLSDIKEAKVVRFFSTGILEIVGQDDAVRQLCRFSIGYATKFDKLCERFNKLLKGEEIDDSTLENKSLYCPKCGMMFTDPARKVCPNCLDKGSIMRRLLSMFTLFKKQTFFICLCVVSSAIFGMIAPYFGSKILYDEVLEAGGKYFGQVLYVVGMMVTVRFIGVLLAILYGVVTAKVTSHVTHDLRTRIFSSLQYLSVNFFTSKQTGALMTRVDNDTSNIFYFFVDIVPYMIVNIVTLAGTLVIMFTLNVYLTLLILTATIFMSAYITQFSRRRRKLYRKFHVAYRNVNAVISDSLNGQRVVKAFSKEQDEINRFDMRSGIMRDVEMDINVKIATTFPKVWLMFRFAAIGLWTVGGLFIMNNLFGLTFGALSALSLYSNSLVDPITFLMWLSDRLTRCLVAASRVFEIIDAEPSVKEAENPVRLDTLNGHIVLTNVNFEYDSGRPIIKNLSLEVKPGQMFGIVGKTGAGKSTIINLMSRLYDVKDGSITIDGVSIKDIAFDTLKAKIGVVSQETFLFMGTIAENIAYARPEASMDEIILAAKSAYAHDFILKLENGYDTRIGSGGISLSGGERQRISIARAILQNPSILILDEATASMDTQTEANIKTAIDSLKEGRTIISIAHRLSTLRDANMLAVIDDGKMIETGTHDELITKKGSYYELYKVQSEALKFIGIGE